MATRVRMCDLPARVACDECAERLRRRRAGACAVGAERLDTAVALLDRIDRLVTAARKDLDSDDVEPIGTSGRTGAWGTVKVEAANIDEIRAEIAQIRLLLKKQE